MVTQYSGRTSAYAHKRDDWQSHDISDVKDCIQTVQVFRVQWSNCPIEVYEEVAKLWRADDDLRNGSNFSWSRDEEYWTPEDEDDDTVKTIKEHFPLIDEYLMSRGISEIEINYWW